ncbi:FAD:protein FMN transferase [Peptococcus simiae]|uniref:FAD:protein FMN transferase n=1 Tax=Peptococcus simiae TaxID=1643805 RepID=UPI00398167DF
MKKSFVSICMIGALALSACQSAAQPAKETDKNDSTSKAAVTSQKTDPAADTSAFESMDLPPITYGDSGYAKAPVSADADGFALDTTIHIRLFAADKAQAQKAMAAAFSEVNRFNHIFSATSDGGEVTALNKRGEGKLSPEALALFDKAMAIYTSTGGAYNVALYPVTHLWGFGTGDYRRPDNQTLSQALALTNPKDIRVNPQTGQVKFAQAGMGLDFDGISQGALSNRLMEVLDQQGIKSGLVIIDGNVQVLGRHPDKTDFRVGIQDPKSDLGYIGQVNVNNKAVITTGDYQRQFQAGGQTWHSVLDPETGMPAVNGLHSVSVIAKNGATASALSRALYVMGPAKAIDYWRQHADEFDMVLYYDNEQVAVTGGIASSYIPNNRPAPDIISVKG